MFWKGVAGYLPVNLVQGVVGLATIMAFTRLLTPEAFGAYALGFSVMSLAHTLIFTWNEAALARFWAAKSTETPLPAVQGAWLRLAAVFPLVLLAAAAWPLDGPLKAAVLAGLLAVLPRSLARLVQERRRAAGEVRAAALMDMAQTAGGFAIGAALAALGFGGAAPLAGMGLAALLALPFAARELPRAAAWRPLDRGRLSDHLAFGAPVALSLILALVLSTTDRFLLAVFLDEGAVGLYHAGYSLSNRTLDVVFIWLGAAGGPALVMALERGGRPALAAAARDQAALMILIAVPAALGLALVARPLAEVMIGPQLSSGAARVTPWIAVSGLLAGLTTYYFHQAFTLARRTPLLLAAMAVPAGLNLVLNLALIPRFGLDGALWATPLSYGAGLAASWALGRRVMPLPIPWRVGAEALAAGLAMALAVSALPATGGLPELILKALAGGIVYTALIAALDSAGLRSRGLALARRIPLRSPA